MEIIEAIRAFIVNNYFVGALVTSVIMIFVCGIYEALWANDEKDDTSCVLSWTLFISITWPLIVLVIVICIPIVILWYLIYLVKVITKGVLKCSKSENTSEK